MKHTTLAGFLIGLATLVYAGDEGKTIRVDETSFSPVYPAVWFSPATGEIAPLKEKTEVPPEPKYEIWIEPRDPEFGYNPDQKPQGVGFALIGRGPEAFTNPKLPANPKLQLKITHLLKENQAQEQLVFFCQAKTSRCLIMLTSMDARKNVIVFQWRRLPAAADVPEN